MTISGQAYFPRMARCPPVSWCVDDRISYQEVLGKGQVFGGKGTNELVVVQAPLACVRGGQGRGKVWEGLLRN